MTKKDNLGNKVIDKAKYIGKNFWKVLPIASSINYDLKRKNQGNRGEDEYTLKGILHDLYALAGVSAIAGYFALVSSTDAWSPGRQFQELGRIEAEKKKQENKERMVECKYKNIFRKENPQNFQDSLDIYLKYGLPIKLLNPSFQEKEEAVNKLEKAMEEKE